MYPRLAQLGSLVIPTYSVIAAVGLVLALLFAEWCAPRARVSRDRVWTFSLAALGCTILFSRVALIAEMWPAFRTYPRLIVTLPTLSKFGPLIVPVSAAVCLFAMQLPVLRTLDAVTPGALLLLSFLHIASFFAGDDLGSRTALAVGNLVRGDEGHHPVALYAAVLTAIVCAAATFALLRGTRTGATFGIGLAGVSVARFLADEFRPTYLLPSAGISGFLRADQLALLALVIAGMLLLLDWSPRRAK